ncbi:condensation domain-containing protein [Streptomyces malaysiensis]|uniref:Condensation domain-containing protein n=1 Tax=Streptomyces malaysiensis subsp. samsunensis TaxID=459658 RepID=A0A9X2RY80_STRMQ|nr:condensation domain-containing protein [Streptomyces samsunensis]MCQ8835062.1 condensation domain-containing protein [Streptomyces samsunensis]
MAAVHRANSRAVHDHLADRLRALCQEEGASLFMALLAGFYVVLHRYSGQADLPVGGTNDPHWRRACAVTVPDIDAHVRRWLPEPVVPAHYVPLPELPLTSNGKTDRAQLRRLAADPEVVERAAWTVATRELTGTEQVVSDVWRELLDCGDVTPDDDFFGLGGHSLLTLQVVFRLRKRLNIALPARAPFDHRTLAELAACVDALRAPEAEPEADTAPPPLTATSRAGALPASCAQERLWFMDRLNPGDPRYNVPAFDRIHGPLDPEALSRALDALVARHEVLRTLITAPEGTPRQEIRPPEPVPFPLVDLTALPPIAREAELDRLVRAEYHRPFDLAEGPVLRAHLVRLAPEDHALLLSLHHIVHDGWSFGLFNSDLAAFYQALAEGGEPDPDTPPVQYADYAVWQRRLLDEGHWDGQLAYWKRRLAGVTELPPLATDHPRPVRPTGGGRLLPVSIPAEAVGELRRLCRTAGTTPFAVLLTAFGTALCGYTGEREVTIGTDVAGRTAAETQEMLGFFVNQLVLRVDLAGRPTRWELLSRVHGTVLEALSNQDVPFERVVQALNPPRSRRHSPLFQSKLVLNSTPGRPGLELAGAAQRRLLAGDGRCQRAGHGRPARRPRTRAGHTAPRSSRPPWSPRPPRRSSGIWRRAVCSGTPTPGSRRTTRSSTSSSTTPECLTAPRSGWSWSSCSPPSGMSPPWPPRSTSAAAPCATPRC